MKTESLLGAVARFARNLALAEAAILLLTGAVSWFLGWRTLYAYSNALMWAGILVMGVGVYSLFGAVRFQSDFRYQFSRTVMPNTLEERTQQGMADVLNSSAFTLIAGLAGLLTLLVSIILKQLWY